MLFIAYIILFIVIIPIILCKIRVITDFVEWVLYSILSCLSGALIYIIILLCTFSIWYNTTNVTTMERTFTVSSNLISNMSISHNKIFVPIETDTSEYVYNDFNIDRVHFEYTDAEYPTIYIKQNIRKCDNWIINNLFPTFDDTENVECIVTLPREE